MLLTILELAGGPSVGKAELVCKPWREAIAASPALYLRLLQTVEPEEAALLVKVRARGSGRSH